jgi:transposase
MKTKENNTNIIKAVINFLRMIMTETLAKRIVSMVLLSVGVQNAQVTELTGLCDKSVRVLKKSIESGEIGSLFHVGGGGRKRKLTDVESAVVEEIEKNDYQLRSEAECHSQQQIADMVHEKYGIKVSLPVIARLLKKTKSNV